jgi:hypothetical protein
VGVFREVACFAGILFYPIFRESPNGVIRSACPQTGSTAHNRGAKPLLWASPVPTCSLWRGLAPKPGRGRLCQWRSLGADWQYESVEVKLALGYEDLNDQEELRSDPPLRVLAEKADSRGESRAQKRDQGRALASKSTLNRLERRQA